MGDRSASAILALLTTDPKIVRIIETDQFLRSYYCLTRIEKKRKKKRSSYDGRELGDRSASAILILPITDPETVGIMGQGRETDQLLRA